MASSHVVFLSAVNFFHLFVTFCLLTATSTYGADQAVPAMYVFGDSLVDVGNNNYLKLSLAKADFPHNGVDYTTGKPTGRFSNGKNAADFLAEKVGLPTSPPYLSKKSNDFLQGVSFASGGAGIFNGTDELFHQSIPLTQQVSYYSSVYGTLVQRLGSNAVQERLSKSLFTIVIGSNDLFGYFKSGSRVSKQYTPQQYINLMLSTLQSSLKRLHNLGARKFVIAGVGAIGCCPSQRSKNKTEECDDESNYWSIKYNEGLQPMLQGLKSQLKDINYSYFDVYYVFQNFIQKPTDYGFKEIKAACCGLGNLKAQIPCVPISTYCSNRSDHIFWDLYHPTEAAARMLVDAMFSGTQQYARPVNLKELVAV